MTQSNILDGIFKSSAKKLSIYLTAGYPKLEDTALLLPLLQDAGVDFVEIGIPFSDSIMDGPVILESHQVALKNGMTIDVLFRQLTKLRGHMSIPIILMGSMNPVYQYGFEKFCRECGRAGVSGLLLPDLPLADFEKYYRACYQDNDLAPIFMITPQTSGDRLKQIDAAGTGFLYAVSSSSTTGAANPVVDSITYFEQLKGQKLRNPVVVGFNINTREDVRFVQQYASGAIVGSAFIKALRGEINAEKIRAFIESLRN